MKSTDFQMQNFVSLEDTTLLPTPVYSKPPPIFHIIRRCPQPITPTVRKIFKIEKVERLSAPLTNQDSQSIAVGKKNPINGL